MCGRFTLTTPASLITQLFHLSSIPDLEPRYNVAPSQTIATVAIPSKQEGRQFQWMRWGLIPSWAKDEKIGYRTINARVETLAEKPSFRTAIKQRRCLIVADGFYEWKSEGKKKQPYYFQLQEGQVFAFAGLWDKWQSPAGESIVSCTIITTEANEVVRPVHERMPVILPEKDWDAWLDLSLTEPQEILPLLKPYASEVMQVNPVSLKVNSPAHEGRDCIQVI